MQKRELTQQCPSFGASHARMGNYDVHTGHHHSRQDKKFVCSVIVVHVISAYNQKYHTSRYRLLFLLKRRL